MSISWPRSPRLIRASFVAVTVFGVLLGVVAVWLKGGDGVHSAADTALSGLSGFLFLAAGVVAYLRRPANGSGLLMVLVGIGFFAEDLQLSRDPWLYSLGLLFTHASAPFVVHLVLAFPYGRLRSRPAKVLTIASYVGAFGFCLLGALFTDIPLHGPRTTANLLLITDEPTVAVAAGIALKVWGVAVAAGVVVALAHRFRSDRQLRAPLTLVLLISVGTGIASAIGSAVGPVSALYPIFLGIYKVGFCLWPLAFLYGVLTARPSPIAIADLLIAARRPGTVAELRDLLAAALHDPSLRLGRWQPESGTFIDTDGHRVDLPAGADHTAVRLADGHGRPVGMLVRRGSPWENTHLTHAVAELAGLVLTNQRLAAEVTERLAEGHDSRVRLVSLADEERRRVERNLHDGAQQRLVTVALGIQLARQQIGPQGDQEVAALLTSAAEGAAAAMVELRELARGIHPAVLTEGGLVPAVVELVERSPLPVRLAASALPRLPAAVEATAYFVVSEALTNALKHAHAGWAEVRLGLVGDRLHVEVVDDGIGGAEPAPGSGLCGLRDRVCALDGELRIDVATGSGTAVIADIPRG